MQTIMRTLDWLKRALTHQRHMVHNVAVGQSSLPASGVDCVALLSPDCLSKTQCTQWTLGSSSTAAAAKLLSSSGSDSMTKPNIFLLHPVNCLLILFFFPQASFQVPWQAASKSVATKREPQHQDSASRQAGQGTNSLGFWQPASSLQWNPCGTVSKSFFLPIHLGIVFCLTKTMGGLIYGVSNKTGEVSLDGRPRDEQRVAFFGLFLDLIAC